MRLYQGQDQIKIVVDLTTLIPDFQQLVTNSANVVINSTAIVDDQQRISLSIPWRCIWLRNIIIWPNILSKRETHGHL